VEELEARLVEEETQRRLTATIEERVQEIMNSDSVQQSLNARLVEERKVLEEQVRLLPFRDPHPWKPLLAEVPTCRNDNWIRQPGISFVLYIFSPDGNMCAFHNICSLCLI